MLSNFGHSLVPANGQVIDVEVETSKCTASSRLINSPKALTKKQ